MKNNGFTFVEILVVLSIIMIVSVISVGQFGNFLDKNYIDTKTEFFISTIDELDKKVKTGDIYDYEVLLSTGSWFKYSTNNYGPYTISIIPEVDFLSYTGIIQSSSTNTGIILGIKTYNGNKIDKNVMYVSTGSYTVSFGETLSYMILSEFSLIQGNTIYLQFYSEDNLLGQENIDKRLLLESINTKNDGSGDALTGILLKNINGKKVIKDTGTDNEYNEIFLFFSRNDYKTVVKLTTN